MIKFKHIILIIFGITVIYVTNFIYQANVEYTVKAVVVNKSIDTLNYRCGYKRRYVCTGVFNRIRLNSNYGYFIDDVCIHEYNGIKVGDSITYKGTAAYLWVNYNLHVRKYKCECNDN